MNEHPHFHRSKCVNLRNTVSPFIENFMKSLLTIDALNKNIKLIVKN